MNYSRTSLASARPIDALEWLAKLTELRGNFAEAYGFEPENLSHWNPKAQFRDELEALVPAPRSAATFTDYAYSTDLDLHRKVLDVLGEPARRSCLFTPSGTSSIGNMVAYLRNIGVGSIGAIRPYYFVVEEFARFCGLDFQDFSVTRDATGAYHLPSARQLIQSGCDAVWLTSPVYGTSVYFREAEIDTWLDELAATKIILVVDESLAHVHRAVIPKASRPDRLFGIYVPHKALSLNGFRFSALSFPSHLQDSFDQWSDLFSGGLPNDSLAALRHFCSSDFPASVRAAQALQARQSDLVACLVAAIDGVELDPDADGHFRHIYVQGVPAALQSDMAFLKRIFFAAGASFIPAARFGHPDQSGFCFRVNLLRLDEAAMGGLYRLLTELARADA